MFFMSWEEIDKLLVKMFDSHIKKKYKLKSTKAISQFKSQSSGLFTKEWFENFTREGEEFEKFDRRRMICSYCKKRITDDKFIIIPDPEFPEDYLKQLYFHSKGGCNPRLRYKELARKEWLVRQQIIRELSNSK